jgi:ATP-dependent DNA helicase RecQ
VLLYSDDDAETQFALSAISQLTPRDIRQLLRGLRRSKRKSELLVITSGELLRDDQRSKRRSTARTKWRTRKSRPPSPGSNARAFWNVSRTRPACYQGKPQVESLENAERRIRMGLPYQRQRRQWLAILQVLMNAEGPESLTIDRLAELPEFQTAGQPVLRTTMCPRTRCKCCARWTA